MPQSFSDPTTFTQLLSDLLQTYILGILPAETTRVCIALSFPPEHFALRLDNGDTAADLSPWEVLTRERLESLRTQLYRRLVMALPPNLFLPWECALFEHVRDAEAFVTRRSSATTVCVHWMYVPEPDCSLPADVEHALCREFAARWVSELDILATSTTLSAFFGVVPLTDLLRSLRMSLRRLERHGAIVMTGRGDKVDDDDNPAAAAAAASEEEEEEEEDTLSFPPPAAATTTTTTTTTAIFFRARVAQQPFSLLGFWKECHTMFTILSVNAVCRRAPERSDVMHWLPFAGSLVNDLSVTARHAWCAEWYRFFAQVIYPPKKGLFHAFPETITHRAVRAFFCVETFIWYWNNMPATAAREWFHSNHALWEGMLLESVGTLTDLVLRKNNISTTTTTIAMCALALKANTSDEDSKSEPEKKVGGAQQERAHRFARFVAGEYVAPPITVLLLPLPPPLLLHLQRPQHKRPRVLPAAPQCASSPALLEPPTSDRCPETNASRPHMPLQPPEAGRLVARAAAVQTMSPCVFRSCA